MSVSGLLVNTCTLTPITNGKSTTAGSMTTVVGTPVTSVPCNVQVVSGQEAVRLGREDGSRLFKVFFLSTVTIDTRYRISSIAGGGIVGVGGLTLDVISPPQDTVGRGAYTMVMAEEAQA